MIFTHFISHDFFIIPWYMVFFYHLVASTEQKVPKWVYLSVTFLNLSAAKYNNNMVEKIKQKNYYRHFFSLQNFVLIYFYRFCFTFFGFKNLHFLNLIFLFKGLNQLTTSTVLVTFTCTNIDRSKACRLVLRNSECTLVVSNVRVHLDIPIWG